MKLHLGVLDIPYAYDQQTLTKKGKVAKRRRAIKKSITTGDVAEILEAKYSLMETFYEMNKQEIADELAKSVVGAYENLLMGGPKSADPTAEAASWIEQRFRQDIEQKKFDGVIAGVATQASLDGVNHRLARPYARRDARPSFDDTGLFKTSFKVWTGEF